MKAFFSYHVTMPNETLKNDWSCGFKLLLNSISWHFINLHNVSFSRYFSTNRKPGHVTWKPYTEILSSILQTLPYSTANFVAVKWEYAFIILFLVIWGLEKTSIKCWSNTAFCLLRFCVPFDGYTQNRTTLSSAWDLSINF